MGRRRVKSPLLPTIPIYSGATPLERYGVEIRGIRGYRSMRVFSGTRARAPALSSSPNKSWPPPRESSLKQEIAGLGITQMAL